MSFDDEWPRFEKALRGYIAAKICPSCPQAGQGIVDDLVQETATKAFGGYDPTKCLTWAYVKNAANWALADCKRRKDRCFPSVQPPGPNVEPPGQHIPEPDESAAFWELLKLLASKGGPPQEVACFLYVKLLEYKPEDVVTYLGSRIVGELLKDGLSSYAELFDRPDTVKKRLEQLFADMLRRAPASSLADYFQEFTARAVTEAWYNVRRRVLRTYIEGGIY